MPLTSELIFAHGLHLYQLKFLMKFNAQKSLTLLFWFKHTATSIGLGAAHSVGDGPAAAWSSLLIRPEGFQTQSTIVCQNLITAIP